MSKKFNLGESVLKVGQKVKLDKDYNTSIKSKFLNKTYKVVGFWYNDTVVKNDTCINKPHIRCWSGIVIKDNLGRKYNVNRFQLKRR